jgi:chromosomal replication initiation ATPase DnaA
VYTLSVYVNKIPTERIMNSWQVVSIARTLGEIGRLLVGLEQELMINSAEEKSPSIKPTDVVKAAAEAFSLQEEDLASRKRATVVVQARVAVVYLCRRPPLSLSLVQIGNLLARDHSAIVYYETKVPKLIKTRSFRHKLTAIKENLGTAQ